MELHKKKSSLFLSFLLLTMFAVVVPPVADAHTVEVAYEVHPNGDVTIYAGTYHSTTSLTGGVIVDGIRHNFTSNVAAGVPDLAGIVRCPTARLAVRRWQAVTIGGLAPGPHTVTTTTDTAVEWPWCGFPTLEVTGSAGPELPFTNPITSVFPDDEFLSCLVGHFDLPSDTDSSPHFWFIRPRDTGTLSLKVVATAVNPLEEVGSITAELFDPTGTSIGLKNVIHPSGPGASPGDENSDTIFASVTDGDIYRVRVERELLPPLPPPPPGFPPPIREAHHYKLGFDVNGSREFIDVGLSSPTFRYFEHETQYVHLNLDAAETDVELAILVDTDSEANQATELTVFVFDSSGTLIHSELVSTGVVPAPAPNVVLDHHVEFTNPYTAGGTVTVRIEADGHYRLEKHTGEDTGVYIDSCEPLNLPPTAISSLDPPTPDGTNGWYKGAVTATLSGTDEDGTIEEIRYRVDPTGPLPAPPPPTIFLGSEVDVDFDDDPEGSDDGHHLIGFRVVDDFGAVSEPAQATFKIDSTNPSISSSQTETGWTNAASVDVSFSCSDATSGITPANCGPDQSVLTEGTTLVTGAALDHAGNTAQTTATVLIDRTDPVLSCNANDIVPPDAPISFTASSDDDGLSGVTTVVTGFSCWTINGSGRRIDKGESCVVDFSGDTLKILDSGGVGDNIDWTVTATDEAGNTSTEMCSITVNNPGGGQGQGGGQGRGRGNR